MKIRISKIISRIQTLTDLENLLYWLRGWAWNNDERVEEIISETDDNFNVFDFKELDPDKVQEYVNVLLQALDDEFSTEFKHFLLNNDYVRNRVVKKMEIKWDWEE